MHARKPSLILVRDNDIAYATHLDHYRPYIFETVEVHSVHHA